MRVRASIFDSSRKNGFRLPTSGRWFAIQLSFSRGEVSGNGHRLVIRPPGPGFRIRKLGAEPWVSVAFTGGRRVTSGPTPSRRFFPISALFEALSRSREQGFSTAYGNANLLPLIVPVKRETPQVVSSTMTGLMRGWWICFPQEEFMGRSQLRGGVSFWGDSMWGRAKKTPKTGDTQGLAGRPFLSGSELLECDAFIRDRLA
jgi:hypothetical protein